MLVLLLVPVCEHLLLLLPPGPCVMVLLCLLCMCLAFIMPVFGVVDTSDWLCDYVCMALLMPASGYMVPLSGFAGDCLMTMYGFAGCRAWCLYLWRPSPYA